MLNKASGMMDAVVHFHMLEKSCTYSAAHHYNHKCRADDLIGRHPEPGLQPTSRDGLE